MKKKIKPFKKGWEKLGGLERLTIWFDKNKHRLGNTKLLKEYRTLMENFYISCKCPGINDYNNFSLIDIRHYPEAHQRILAKGFFAMYNTSEALLELKSIKIFNPRWN